MRVRANASAMGLVAAVLVVAACAGTDTGNPFDDGPGGGIGGTMGGAGGGSGTGAGAAGGGGAGVGGMPGDAGAQRVPRRRCEDGTVPPLPSAAVCGGSCSAGWFCCSALEEAPFCAHESHPCYRIQVCGDGDAGVSTDAAVSAGSDTDAAGDDDAG